MRESTVDSHICEQKHRWREKDNRGNQIGYQAWLQFYRTNTRSKKHNTYEEFIKSSYYIPFVKFGTFCVNISAINISRFTEYLLKNQVRVYDWCSDHEYTKYLIDYLKVEDAFDAIARSVETTFTLAENDGIQSNDVFRYGNTNKICYAITIGKISPWMLYCSDSGVQFLDKLNPDHVRIISDYINPEQWALKFHREPELQKQIRDTLKEAGY